MQARLAYAMDIWLKEGRVPSILEGNKREPLAPLGRRWNGYGQVILGASLETACESPAHLAAAVSAFPKCCPYVMTYRPDKDKVYVVLRAGADKAAALDGAFLAHLWLHEIHEATGGAARQCLVALPAAAPPPLAAGCETLAEVQARGNAAWRAFSDQAGQQGWQLTGTMLAIGNSRLLSAP